MSDLKFSCPSCGQHIQCDEDHAGENIPCPDCAHLIRVPATAPIVAKPATAPAETPFASMDESKVSYTSAEEEKEADAKTVPTLEENFAAAPGAPTPENAPLTDREAQLAAARAAHSAQVSNAVKPRLSFILSGGAAPAGEENKLAADPDHVSGAPNQPRPEIKTVNE